MSNLVKTVLSILLVSCAAVAGTGHAQITFRAAASAGVASGAFSTITHAAVGTVATDSGNCPQSMSPGLPAGTVAGNLLIAVVSSKDDNPIVMAGWNTLYANVDTTTYQAVVFWRIATGADPTAITKTGASCNVMIGRISRFTGVDETNPFDGAVGASVQNAGTVTTGSITTTFANSMLVITAHTADNSDTGVPAGFTEPWDSPTTTGSDVSAALKYRLETTAGAKGPFTMTKTQGSDPNHGVLFALRPMQPSLTINVPPGTTIDDVMVAAIAVTGSGVVITPPPGWTAEPATLQGSANTSRQQLFYRVVTGAEPASYTWEFQSAHAGAVGGIVTYIGVDTTTPVEAFSGNTTPQGGDTNLQHRALGVTTTVPDTMVVSTHSVASAQAWTPQGGIVEREDILSQAAGANGIAMSMNESVQVLAGATGDKLSNIAANGDAGVAQILVLRPPQQNPVLQWTMDQPSWSGTAGELVDASGNGLNGRAFGGASTASLTPAIAGSPGTCRYGAFDGNDDYVEVADNALLDITDELTVMAWIRPTAYPTAGNLKSFLSKDNNYEAHVNSAGKIDWWWGGGSLELISSGSVALNTWTHVTLVYSRAGGFQRIYLNGVQDPATNNQSAALATNNLPFQVAADQGFAGRNFAGSVDEVYVFRQALGAGRVQQYMNATRPCVLTDHYALVGSTSGVTCDATTVQIIAHDTSHTAVAPSSGTILTLSTSTGTGVWQAGLLSGTGAWAPSGANNGIATYVWPGGESIFSVMLRQNTPATVGINVIDSNGKVEAIIEDLSIAFADSAFRITANGTSTAAIGTQIAGKNSNVGFGSQTLYLQAIRTDTATGTCVGAIQSQTATIEMAGARINPTGSTSQVSVLNSSNAPVALATGAGAPGGYSSVTLAFDAQSKAPLVINYPNAGSIALYARYLLPAPPAGTYVSGSSNTFVVRPFGLRISGPPSGRTGPGSTVYAKAGQTWPDAITVTAVAWESADDTNNDGVPDSDAVLSGNAVTTNFGLESTPATVTITHTLAEPSGGNSGTLSAPLSAFSGGSATAPASWSEVGLINLFAASSNYLGGGQNVSNSASGYTGVGRFTPYDFAVVRNTPVFSPACPSTFTYIGQRFNYSLAPVLTVTARNSAGITTQNYAGTFMKITNTFITPNSTIARYSRFDALGAGSTPALDVSALPLATVDPAVGTFTNGVGNLSFSGGAVGAVFTRGLQVAPFNADIALTFTLADADGIVVASVDGSAGVNPVSFGTATAGNGIGFAGGATAKQMRFGRLRLGNAFGSELLDLPIPMEAQYLNGNGVYVTNVDDSCTSIALGNLVLSSGAATVGGAFVSGKGNLKITKPLSKVSINLCIDLDGTTPTDPSCVAPTPANMPWLQWKWSGATFDKDPSARATFGVFKNADEFIYLRENF